MLAVVTLAQGVVLTARLFWWPATSSLTSADAVVVLAGDYGDRLERGLALMQAGVAPTLVLDGLPDGRAAAALCESRQRFEVVCLRPLPDSTRTEAQAAGRLAATRGWERVLVVTTRSHVTRAGVMFRRCTPAEVDVTGTDPPYGLRVKLGTIVHELLGYANAVLRERHC
jgi:uncharacterized SAM-binding protein YcdF (DUF218 family)